MKVMNIGKELPVTSKLGSVQSFSKKIPNSLSSNQNNSGSAGPIHNCT